MENRKDYYGLLGVSRDASTDAIRRAYRRLARRHRPGLGAPAPSPELQELRIAYETLTDAERRRRYDESMGNGGDTDPFEPLAWSFARRPGVADLRRPVSPGTLSGEIVLSRSEAAVGGVMPLDVPLTASCPTCQGTGGFAFDCQRCRGEGKVQRRFPVPVRIPRGVREGTVFQVAVDEPTVLSILLTVHVRPL